MFLYILCSLFLTFIILSKCWRLNLKLVFKQENIQFPLFGKRVRTLFIQMIAIFCSVVISYFLVVFKFKFELRVYKEPE